MAPFCLRPFLLQERARCSAPITGRSHGLIAVATATLALVRPPHPWLFPTLSLTRRPAGPSSAATAAARWRWRRPCAASWSCAGAVSGRVRAERLSFESQQQLGSWTGKAAQYRHAGEEEEAGYRVSTLMLEAGGEEHEARALLACLALNPVGAPLSLPLEREGRSCCWPGPCWGGPSCWCWTNPSMALDQGQGFDDVAGRPGVRGLRLVVIVNRFDEIPFATHLGLLGECRLLLAGGEEVLGSQEGLPSWHAPKRYPPFAATADDPEPLPPGPRVVMKAMRIVYGDQVIIDGPRLDH